MVLLWRGSREMGDAARLDARATSRIFRIVLAALIMGAVLWVTDRWVVRGLIEGAGGTDIVGLVVLCMVGIASYFASGVALRAFTLSDLKSAFRR